MNSISVSCGWMGNVSLRPGCMTKHWMILIPTLDSLPISIQCNYNLLRHSQVFQGYEAQNKDACHGASVHDVDLAFVYWLIHNYLHTLNASVRSLSYILKWKITAGTIGNYCMRSAVTKRRPRLQVRKFWRSFLVCNSHKFWFSLYDVRLELYQLFNIQCPWF